MNRFLFVGVVCFSLGCGKEDPDVVETGTVETGDSETGEESGADSGSDEEVGTLTLSPAEIRVAPATEFSFRAQVSGEAVEAVFESSDSSILELSADGQARAISDGEVEISATWEGQSALAAVEVSSSGEMSIQVVDGATNSPLSDMRVLVEGETYFTDTSGRVSLEVEELGAQSILVYPEDAHLYTSALFLDVMAQDLILPLRTRDAGDPGSVVLEGDVDLSETLLSGPDEKGAGLITIGMGSVSFQQGALFFPLEQLFASNRTLSLEGIPVDIPSNLFIRDYGESWEGTAHPGAASVWAFGGPVPRSELAQGLSGVAEVLQFLVPHFDAFTWTHVDGIEAVSGGTHEVDLLPNLPFDDRIEVVLPPLPDGIQSTTNALLISLSGDSDAGPLMTGMGQGKSSMLMSRVNPSDVDGESGQVLAIAQVDGFGSDGAQSLALVDIVEGIAELTEWQELASILEFDKDSMMLKISADSSADVLRAHVRSASGDRRDIYMPAGDQERTLPSDGPPIGLASTSWNLMSIETPSETYEGLLTSGGLSQVELRKLATSTARTVVEFRPTQ